MKKEKINYLKPSSRTNTNIEDIIYSEDYKNNNNKELKEENMELKKNFN